MKKLSAFLDAFVELAGRGGVRFDTKQAEFVWNANGRVVSSAKIEGQLAKLTEHYSANVRGLADRMVDGRLSVAQFQDRMRSEILDLHRTQYIIGRGGRGAMTPRDWGRLGSSMRWDHYRALDGLATGIANGEYTAGQIQARANMYVSSSDRQYWAGRSAAKMGGGFDEERRLTSPAEHCDDCIGYETMGWVPIGTLPDPGEGSVCSMNCKCRKEYRKRAES